MQHTLSLLSPLKQTTPSYIYTCTNHKIHAAIKQFMQKMEHNNDIHMHDHVQNLLPKRLSGKVSVITGGARGIGAATARAFAENGAYVVIADVLDDLGTALADSIGGRYIHCDVSKEEDVEAAVKLAVTWKGGLDIMFNNAAIGGPSGSITDVDMEVVRKLFSINVNGNVHGIKHAARVMIEGRRQGSIICTCSSAAVMGGLASHPYTCSKGAMLGLMRSSACELGVHGIRVNCISPHGVASDMLVSAYKQVLRREDIKVEEVIQLVGERGSLLRGRTGSPENVAQAALFLASDESVYVNAHNLIIDGGYTAANSSLAVVYQ